ncbi:MAG TPA: amidase [Vicinamibacterales bacterium]|nr:amidase [Vicinamibacterales bacterium]
MRRRTAALVFVVACLAAGTPAWFYSQRTIARSPSATFDLEEATVRTLLQDQQAGRRTARQIAEQYLSRIEALDRRGPSLNAIIELNPDALAIADALDAERRTSGLRGPLHGIPVLVKDNIDTADRMSTTAGSLALEGSIAARDAFVVERLRAAGAVILGKTNLSEWANFRSTHSTSGWSGRGGLVRNPYALDRSACGSSSGTGAAIAASFATIGVGTETDGSIVCPSAATSLVGIKPTVGLVSRSGIVPIAHSQDTAGAMARTVEDAATLLEALAGSDPRDEATTDASRPARVDYRGALDPNGLRGARIGVARAKFFGYSDVADRMANTAIERMKQLGAVVVDPADIPNAGTYDDSELDVLLYEFKADLNAYLGGLGAAARVHSLADVIAFNEANRPREMPFFGQELMLEAQKKGPLTDKAYRDALARNARLSRTEGIDAVMDRLGLDALVAPTANPPWPMDLVNGDHFVGSSSTPAAVAGYPTITVPAGYAFGQPIGISFIGRRWSEARLIALAYAYEQATRHRRPPAFAATVRIGEPESPAD